MISFCELSSSGYLVPIMVTYVSSDTLALLGKIRDHFCFPAVPAAWRKVLACSGNLSGASDSHKTVTAAQQHGVMLPSQLLPIVSLHRTWKKAALSADKLRCFPVVAESILPLKNGYNQSSKSKMLQ